MRRFLLLINIFLFSFCNSQSQGYKIKIEIKGAENTDAWLSYYYEDQYFTVSQIKLDSKAAGIFEGENKLDGGIYFIAVGEKGYFDLLIADDQEFALSTDTSNLTVNMKIKGSDDNDIFFGYQKKMFELVTQKSELDTLKSKMTDSTEINKTEIEISKLNNKLEGLWKETIDEHSESFFATLLKAMHTFDASAEEDPFSYVDFSDDRLIRTPFFYNIIRYHIATYIEADVTQINEENDKLLKKCTNDTVFQYVATYLLNFYRTFSKIGINEVFVHLADNYFLNGKINSLNDTAINLISEQTEIFRSANIGSDAYDFKIYSSTGDSIRVLDFDTQFRFIFFWSIGCGHCETAAQSLKEYYTQITEMNIDILAINTDGKDIESWKKYIEEQGYTWKNGIDLADSSRYKEHYYVCSTPLLYVIDKQGKIANKMFGEDQIQQYIEYITKK